MNIVLRLCVGQLLIFCFQFHTFDLIQISQMNRVSAQFLAGVPLERINLETVSEKIVIHGNFHSGYSILQILPKFSSWDQQLDFLTLTLDHPLVLKYPFKWSYQIAFLKQCISTLETISEEIRDGFYEHLVNLQQKSTSPQKWVYRHFLLPSNEVVSVAEAPQIISEGTTGLSCWQAGIFLADWMYQNPTKFTGKRLLELGSGTGGTGLIVARSCRPRELILSDCHENVLRLLRENVELNGCQDVRVIDLNWDDPSALDELSADPEVILAADVVYDDTIFRPLVDLLVTMTRRNKDVEIYLAATVRNELTLGGFLAMVESSGLEARVVCSSREVENLMNWDDRTEIKLFLIRAGGE